MRLFVLSLPQNWLVIKTVGTRIANSSNPAKIPLLQHQQAKGARKWVHGLRYHLAMTLLAIEDLRWKQELTWT
jgi:hypothetical protein